MLDDRFYTVETPEQIDVAYDVAGIGSRFLAALLDHVFIALILSLSCVLVAVIGSQLDLNLDESIIAGLLGIGVYLGLCAYHIFFETVWNGQTPGKRIVGLRMVRTGGRPLGFLGSTIRNFVRLVDFLPVLYGLGMLVMFIDKRSRRLGDLAAGCMAVRERGSVTLESLSAPPASQPAVVQAAQQITIPNLRAIKREDYDIVQEYLRRAPVLSLQARYRLSQQLVEGLQQRLGYPIHVQTPHQYEDFLRQLAAEYQAIEQIDRTSLVK